MNYLQHCGVTVGFTASLFKDGPKAVQRRFKGGFSLKMCVSNKKKDIAKKDLEVDKPERR